MPTKKKTRPPLWTKRQILDGVFYQLKNGCNWADLQARFPTLFDCILALQALVSGGYP
ncbi:transposase [Nostoc sp.]|uniref:transposase n=1 Tax=Nostoc sp. TaxID=1180 RepID=UPI002FF69602